MKIFSSNLFGAKSGLFNLSKIVEGDDVFLNIQLTSKVLEVDGFPIKIKKGTNPIEAVNTSLKLK